MVIYETVSVSICTDEHDSCSSLEANIIKSTNNLTIKDPLGVHPDITLHRYGLDSSGSGQGPVAGSCEHGNEPSGFIKGREFLDQLRDYYLLRKGSVPLS
jgi:hypothetical protein